MHTEIRAKTRNLATLRRAFSLIELTMVLLLVGIITAVAAPRFSLALQRHRVESAAKRLALDLDVARRMARNSGKTVTVSFNQKTNTYALSNGLSSNRDARLSTVNLSASPYHCTLESVTVLNNQVQFDRFQRTSQQGEIVLRSGSIIRTLTIDTLTGEAIIQ